MKKFVHGPDAITEEFYLVLDGLIEHVEWLSRALVQELVEQEGEPGRQHLLSHTFGSSQQQLGMGFA